MSTLGTPVDTEAAKRGRATSRRAEIGASSEPSNPDAVSVIVIVIVVVQIGWLGVPERLARTRPLRR